MDGRIDVNITFDENNQIRVLSQEKYRETEAMKTETIDFLKKIMSFNEMVTTLIEVLDSQAQKIEDAKLKAVGARNKIEGEEDNRRAKEQELKTLINEKRLLLERYVNFAWVSHSVFVGYLSSTNRCRKLKTSRN